MKSVQKYPIEIEKRTATQQKYAFHSKTFAPQRFSLFFPSDNSKTDHYFSCGNMTKTAILP